MDCRDGGIDSAVTQLLAMLTPDLGVWNKLRSSSRLDLFCGVFLQTPNQGFSLRPETLEDLAKRGLALSMDIYSSDDSSKTLSQ